MTGKDQWKVLSEDEFEELSKLLNQEEKERNNVFLKSVKDGMLIDRLNEDDEITDDSIVMWFVFTFLTDEMRDAFPDIARDYLEGFKKDTIAPDVFYDIPYPRMMEVSWDDAYYFRILLMMVYSARAGSSYSRNYLISLYKTYHKSEYNYLKRLKKITAEDIFNIQVDECSIDEVRLAYLNLDWSKFFDYIADSNAHKPGWTGFYRKRKGWAKRLQLKQTDDCDEDDIFFGNEGLAIGNAIKYNPRVVPVYTSAARLIVMSEMLGIEVIDEDYEIVCSFGIVLHVLQASNITRGEKYRKLRNDIAVQIEDLLKIKYREIENVYNYQKDDKYLPLKSAEVVMQEVFNDFNINWCSIYESKPFILSTSMAEATCSLMKAYPNAKLDFNEMLILSMVQYLSECLCELLSARETELENILGFYRIVTGDEWNLEEDKERSDRSEHLKRTALQRVAPLKDQPVQPEKKVTPQKTEENQAPQKSELELEIEQLKKQLEERELALMEERQKTIQQRALYKKEHDRLTKIDQRIEEFKDYHREAVALREFVYNLSLIDVQEEEIDELTKEQIISSIKDKKVAVIGGKDWWLKKMKSLLPLWSFSVAGDKSVGINAVERSDYIYFFTDALSHDQYRQAMKIINKENKPFSYIGTTNIDECLKQFYEDLC